MGLVQNDKINAFIFLHFATCNDFLWKKPQGEKKKKRDRGEHVRAFSKKVAGVTRVKARKLGCFLDPYI